VQTWLREAFGWQSKTDYWFFDVRSLGGAATMLVCVLYPYVYLLARVAFLEQSASLYEAGRTFGYGRTAMFFRVSLPLARPAIVAGMALTMMETLADYGTVSYFGVNTFTTGIFNAWFSQGDRIAAAKLATMLLVFVAFIMAMENLARRRARFADNSSRKHRREVLRGGRGLLALSACLLPVLVGFLLPLALLLRLAYQESCGTWPALSANASQLLPLATNSVLLAGITALIAVALALWLAYQQRLAPGWLSRAANRAVGLGYAVPGTVIAVGVLIPITRLDHQLADALSAVLGRDVGLILTGGIGVLIYAYLIRFLAISLQACESGFAKITPSMDQAARSLGARSIDVIRRVHLPMLRASLLTAGLMVFVDVMKELPATIVMRPFNLDTLAVRTYTLAKDERLGEASFVALTIVLVGLIPVVFASRAITRSSGAR
jgi:iron(III) transport system permease protein